MTTDKFTKIVIEELQNLERHVKAKGSRLIPPNTMNMSGIILHSSEHLHHGFKALSHRFIADIITPLACVFFDHDERGIARPIGWRPPPSHAISAAGEANSSACSDDDGADVETSSKSSGGADPRPCRDGGEAAAAGGATRDGGEAAAAGGATRDGGEAAAAGGATRDGGEAAAAGGATRDGGEAAAAGGATLDGGEAAAAGGATRDGGEAAAAGGATSDGGEAAAAPVASRFIPRWDTIAASKSACTRRAFEVSNQAPKQHHTFVVRYFADKDGGLRLHRDISDVTVNLSLGPEFTGGQLLLKGWGPLFLRGSHEQAVANRGKFFSQEHKAGTALLHLGSHPHMAEKITSGERLNLIFWRNHDDSRQRRDTGTY